MNYRNPICDNVTLYRVLTQPGGVDSRGVRTIFGFSATHAAKTIRDIQIEMAKEGIRARPHFVPRDWFCRSMDWDWEEIKENAFAEMRALGRQTVSA